MNTAPAAPIQSLPTVLYPLIFKNLTPREALGVTRVSKEFQAIVSQHQQAVDLRELQKINIDLERRLNEPAHQSFKKYMVLYFLKESAIALTAIFISFYMWGKIIDRFNLSFPVQLPDLPKGMTVERIKPVGSILFLGILGFTVYMINRIFDPKRFFVAIQYFDRTRAKRHRIANNLHLKVKRLMRKPPVYKREKTMNHVRRVYDHVKKSGFCGISI